MQQDFDVGVGPVKAVLLVADVADSGACQVLNSLDRHTLWPTRLTGDNDAIGRRHGFASGADAPRIELLLGAFAIERVDHFIGNPVTDFVWMTFRNRLAREQE